MHSQLLGYSLLVSLMAACLSRGWVLFACVLVVFPGGHFWNFFFQTCNFQLCMYWLVLIAISVPAIYVASSRSKGLKGIIKIRKLFHFLSVAMFVPPVLLDQCEFLAIAGITTLALFAALEYVRVSPNNLPVLRAGLNSIMKPFLDTKDVNSVFITSHIQLLAASLLPVWLSVASEIPVLASPIFLLSGLVTVGIGDSSAAVAGLATGKPHRLPRTKKTLEGLLAFIASVFVIYSLITGVTFAIGLATIAAGIAECYSSRYDNLVVPIVFSATWAIFNHFM